MNKSYKINDILSAIDILLDNKERKNQNISKKNNEPLVLNNEVDIKKNNLSNVPKDTEKIILQAEKYLKK
tara:strand:- start:861 stop:1070 length:210 start_codon:yes stop_codon:yes gene_type:complete